MLLYNWFKTVAVVCPAPGAEKLVILISSASEFSRINLFLSENKIAFTPVSSLTLFISFTKFDKSFGNIVADIETASFKPEDNDIDIVPLMAISSIGSIITLVTASANIPDLDAFSLNSLSVYEEEELTGTVKVVSTMPSLKVSMLKVWAVTGLEDLEAEWPVNIV